MADGLPALDENFLNVSLLVVVSQPASKQSDAVTAGLGTGVDLSFGILHLDWLGDSCLCGSLKQG